MGKIIYYVATSIEGYLADENGGVDWLEPFQNTGYDYGYQDFYKSIGYIITGSKTFEQASNFPEGWAFPHATTYIFTSRLLDTQGRDDLLLWKDGIAQLGSELKKRKKDTWLIGGASMAGQFINEGMVDELVLSVMPVLLGKGKSLFEGIEKPVSLALKEQKSFPNGVVQLVYKV